MHVFFYLIPDSLLILFLVSISLLHTISWVINLFNYFFTTIYIASLMLLIMITGFNISIDSSSSNLRKVPLGLTSEFVSPLRPSPLARGTMVSVCLTD
jgi:hypothetical protein